MSEKVAPEGAAPAAGNNPEIVSDKAVTEKKAGRFDAADVSVSSRQAGPQWPRLEIGVRSSAWNGSLIGPSASARSCNHAQNAHADNNDAKHALVDMSTIQLRAEDLVSPCLPHHARWRSFSTCCPNRFDGCRGQCSNVREDRILTVHHTHHTVRQGQGRSRAGRSRGCLDSPPVSRALPS